MIKTRPPRAGRVVDVGRAERAIARRRARRARIALLSIIAGAVAVSIVVPALRNRLGPAAPDRLELAVLVVRGGPEPLIAVAGTRSGGAPAALVVPASTAALVPGHGDGTVGEAAGLDDASLRATVSNLLGVWVEHVAFVEASELPDPAAVGQALGADVEPWRASLERLLSSGTLADLVGGEAGRILGSAGGAPVATLPTAGGTGDVLRPDPDSAASVVAETFGSAPPVPVVILDATSGEGVDLEIAERLLPSGFRIVGVSGAGEVRKQTAVLASGPATLRTAERVASLLGVDVVTVSRVPSGIADVTIVVGEDFGNG